MLSNDYNITSLIAENRVMRERVRQLETGENVAQLIADYESLLAAKDQDICTIKKELAEERAQKREIAEIWQQACEDTAHEYEQKLTELERKIRKLQDQLNAALLRERRNQRTPSEATGKELSEEYKHLLGEYTILEAKYSEVRDKLKEKEKELTQARNIILQTRSKAEKAAAKAESDLRVAKIALNTAKEKAQVELGRVQAELTYEKEQNKQLMSRINKDYTNSSKPSSMNPNHKKINNGRKPTGRKPGGQPGHEPHPRKPFKPDKVVDIPPDEKFLDTSKYRPTGETISKQVVSVSISVNVTDYRTPQFRDIKTGQRVHSDFPDGIKDDVTYDGSIKSLAYTLNNRCNVSIGKTREFIKEISGGRLVLSTGLISRLCKEFSEKTKAERDDIFLKLIASSNMHADFTFCRMNGKQGSIAVTCTDDGLVLYQGRERKGYDGVKGTPMERYMGTLISDHESAIRGHGSRHQECLVHIERYLRSSIENEPNLTWASKMLEWIREAIHYRNECLANDLPYDADKVSDMKNGYNDIIAVAQAEYIEGPPSNGYKEGFNLYKRMSSDKGDYVLFLDDITVAPDNNICERKARLIKRKSAAVMAFRSMGGVYYYCDGMSVMESIVAEGKNLYQEVAARFGIIANDKSG